jgi:hypothetical protein
MEKEIQVKINSLIFGATGAVGRIILSTLLQSNYYDTVTVVARKKLKEWENFPSDQQKKLKFIQCDDFSLFNESKDTISDKLQCDFKFDSIFSCLGGDPTNNDSVKKIDYEYTLSIASLCEKFNIPHFLLVSTKSADPNAFFEYVKIKGQADVDVQKKNINAISIFRPPLLEDREGAKFMEKCLSILPFYSKIKIKDLTYSMLVADVQYQKSDKLNNSKTIYEFKDIKELMNKKI